MKINGTPVQAQQSQKSRQIDEKTSPAGINASALKEQENDDAVVLNVSQRNAVSPDGGGDMDANAMPAVMQSLTDAPESTAQLHANLSPERVVQLVT